MIVLKNGAIIEILPKIISSAPFKNEQTKNLLIEMIKTVLKISPKCLQMASVDTSRLNLFEIIIRMFLESVFSVVKRGIKCGYESIHDNARMIKGKISFQAHIKYNSAHMERCFLEYDEFNENRAENRIIKSALRYLYKRVKLYKSKSDIRTLLNAFQNVDESENYSSDFAQIVFDRETSEYKTALRWSRVFLEGKTFSSHQGKENAFALLFPMEVLFESYVAAQLRKLLNNSCYTILLQDKKYCLFDLPQQFLLKPDIVLLNKEEKRTYIIDTKWKILSNGRPGYTDMYQMFAYQKKYNAEFVVLLYPLSDAAEACEKNDFKASDGTDIRVRFIDLFCVEKSLKDIMSETKKA